MGGLVSELKRRNVFRVAAAYIVIGWLILQVADIVLGFIHAPDWVGLGVRGRPTRHAPRRRQRRSRPRPPGAAAGHHHPGRGGGGDAAGGRSAAVAIVAGSAVRQQGGFVFAFKPALARQMAAHASYDLRVGFSHC